MALAKLQAEIDDLDNQDLLGASDDEELSWSEHELDDFSTSDSDGPIAEVVVSDSSDDEQMPQNEELQ